MWFPEDRGGMSRVRYERTVPHSDVALWMVFVSWSMTLGKRGICLTLNQGTGNERADNQGHDILGGTLFATCLSCNF